MWTLAAIIGQPLEEGAGINLLMKRAKFNIQPAPLDHSNRALLHFQRHRQIRF
jgi:hypothetical protein